MDVGRSNQATSMNDRTSVERRSECELVTTRTIKAPPRLVFEAWTKTGLFMRWWFPKSLRLSLYACKLDARVGGMYFYVFRNPNFPPVLMTFRGRYLEVTSPSRLVWAHEEVGAHGQITTVTFEERDGQTLCVMHDLYPSKQVLDFDISSGSTSWNDESFNQLDELLG